ncbi:MAG TPA: 2-dehydropantoate 2-reductase N-terminal domain-containing protein [Solirubrobacteraceae bacterium]|nr:2-dehydropantoate 2-reductase N-terminal domain-containing protein [Solirubrobacteraceae bacterium]
MPRFVVLGAGAVGGVIASRLREAGEEVVVIARGAHGTAIVAHGLRVESPEGVTTTRLEVAAAAADVAWRADDLVILAVKGQDTPGALDALEAAAPSTIAIACAQNGVDNERKALRRFADVYSIVVQLPSTHLEDGVVIAHSAPVPGSLDIGRHPHGVDERAREIAAALTGAGFSSQPRADVARWKYAKLLRNLGNASQALFGTHDGQAGEVHRRAWAEAIDVLAAAGIDAVPEEEYDARHAQLITPRPVPGREHGGGSSWQSLARGAGTIESNELNGEIVLLGRLHGVPTPVNERLRRAALDAARSGEAPGSRDPAAFLD